MPHVIGAALAGKHHGQGSASRPPQAMDAGRQGAVEAEPLLQQSLSISEKALGPEHPDVGQSLNNLAELYRRWEELEA